MSAVMLNILLLTKITKLSKKNTKTIFTESLLQNIMLEFIIVYSIAVSSSEISPVLAFYDLVQYIAYTLMYFVLFKKNIY
tara:strand:+ start:287 stop:526 length:240 start_codon:yes stop_codon:yes gene_type:complete